MRAAYSGDEDWKLKLDQRKICRRRVARPTVGKLNKNFTDEVDEFIERERWFNFGDDRICDATLAVQGETSKRASVL